jgi:hypothetical protein
MSKAQTNRANAAKSTGPITPAGKAKVAQNARKHGLTARQIVLPGESEAEYEHLLRAYTDQFQPQTPLEFELVSVMAAARWRHRRLTAIETGLYNKELTEDYEDIAGRHLSQEERIVWAYDMLSLRSHAFSVLVRHDAALSRTHDRAFRQLQELRRETALTKQSQTFPEIAAANPAPSTT